MRLRKKVRWASGSLLALCLLGGPGPLRLAAADSAHEADWRRAVLPFLDQHCLACHGAQKQKGGVRLDGPLPDLSVPAQAELWLAVKKSVAQGDMPPEEKPRPQSEAMVALFDWIDAAFGRAAVTTRGGLGRRALRRLTREEFVATACAVLGLSFPYAHLELVESLPDETLANSFANDSNLQTTQALQLRRSLDLVESLLGIAYPDAERIVPLDYACDLRAVLASPGAAKAKAGGGRIDQVPVPSALPGGKPARLSSFGRAPPEHHDPARGVLLSPNPIITGGNQRGLSLLLPQVPEQGILRITVIAGATADCDDGPPRLRASFASDTHNLEGATVLSPAAEMAITAPADAPAEYVLEAPLALLDVPWSTFRQEGKVRLQLDHAGAILHPTIRPADAGKAKLPPPRRNLLLIRSLRVEVLPADRWSPAGGIGLPPESTSTDITAAVGSLLDRTFRRPARPEEAARFAELYRTERAAGFDHCQAWKTVVAAALIAPQTWYLIEAKGAGISPLDGWELASRLSYLLLAGPPDAELRSRAADGSLLGDAELLRQTQRLLQDPRALEFARQFTRPWLDLGELGHIEVRFSGGSRAYLDSGADLDAYERAIRQDLLDEPAHVLLEALRADRPLGELVASQHLLVNDRLAKFYGLTGIHGSGWQRVPAPEDRRGGLLTLASTIATATHGQQRGEIKRGVYLIERFLGIDIPAPPGNVDVKPLDIQLAENKALAKVSPRTHIEQHNAVATCAVCHRRSDPLGFAWDDYDNTGRRRLGKDGRPLPADTSGMLPDGAAYPDFAALRRHLAAVSSPFATAFTERLYAYALGRGLDHGDTQHVQAIQAAAARQGGGLGALLAAMVLSSPFRSK